MATDKSNNHNKKGGRKTLADDILKGIKKDEIVSNAQKVINSAVNVLEEEIAAGILAAKRIEKKVLDVDDIRNDPDDLMNRIRRDTHEAVDLFLDALSAITKQVNTLAFSENEKAGTTEEKKNTSNNKSQLTILETDRPLKPGETEVFVFSLMEDSAKRIKIKFQKTDLFGPNNQVIESKAIKITPSSFSLKPKEETEVTISLSLPKNARAGVYNAIITDSGNVLVKVVLNVEVTE